MDLNLVHSIGHIYENDYLLENRKHITNYQYRLLKRLYYMSDKIIIYFETIRFNIYVLEVMREDTVGAKYRISK